MYDVNGALISRSKKIVNKDSDFKIDISDNPSGVYYLEVIQTNGITHHKKLVLIK